MIAPVQEHLGNYLADFTNFVKSGVGSDLPWLCSLREDAFDQFAETGFPTTRVEDWRFTNVSALSQGEFQLARPGTKLSPQQIAPYRMPGTACEVVFINGHFAPELSSLEELPEGLFVTSLANQIRENPEAIRPELGRYLNTKRDPFCALNTAFLEDGTYIRIARGIVVGAPIHLLYVSAPSETPLVSYPRNLVIAENGAEIALSEEYVSLDGARMFCNAATEIVAGDSAVVSHHRIERESTQTSYISTLRIQQGRNANVSSHSVLLGGALVRNNIHPVLAGEGSECLINGLFLGTGREHLDNYMFVEHASPHCESRQFYNGILDDQSQGVFHGRIVVHKDAQKTDAKQTNRNLLLSDNAQIHTKPQLEIFADDVKCTHGATIGQIEENALFYLRARGIDELSARRLLLEAFASECLDRVKEGPIRKQMRALIRARVLQMAAIGVQRTKETREDDNEPYWEEVQ